MLSIIFIVGIAILVASTAFISSSGKIIDRRRKGLRCVTNKGWITIVLNIGVIILSILQVLQNEREIKNNEKESNLKQIHRDSLLKAQYDLSLNEMKNKFDTSNEITVSTVSETLGKYGYLLDSSNKTLIKIIKDSSKTKVIIPEDPVLQLCAPEGITVTDHKNGKYYYKLSFCLFDGSCSNIKLTSTVLTTDSMPSTRFTYSGKYDCFSENLILAKGSTCATFISISDEIPYGLIYFIIQGSYDNLDNAKSFDVNTIYYFNPKTKTMGCLKGQTEKDVRIFLKTYI